MTRRLLWMAVALTLGCTPEFDRCRIPGAAGCGLNDGGAGCAPMPGAAPVFETSFDDVTIDDFVVSGDPGADWVIEEGELRQRQPMARGSSALVEGVDVADVWLSARMRRTAGVGGGAVELTVRATAGGDSYHCNWEPLTGEFEIQRDSMRAALTSTLVDLGAIADYDPDAPVTMQLSAVGSQLRCCLLEYGGPSLTVLDDALTTGAVGARTFEVAAAYERLEVRPAP